MNCQIIKYFLVKNYILKNMNNIVLIAKIMTKQYFSMFDIILC